MLEMADAYATLANGGTHVPTTVISKVVFPNGKVVNLSNPPHNRVFSDGEAYEGTQVLKTVIQDGTGTSANYGCPAAGKTGTAENMDNAWFVGYTPKLSTAVWVGYPQGNIPMGPTDSAARSPRRSGGSSCRRPQRATAATFPQPTDPFIGTAFTGPHSSAKEPPPPKTTPGASQLNNPTLFAQPPAQTTTQTGGATVPGGGLTGGGGGNGGGHGGGHGHHHG